MTTNLETPLYMRWPYIHIYGQASKYPRWEGNPSPNCNAFRIPHTHRIGMALLSLPFAGFFASFGLPASTVNSFVFDLLISMYSFFVAEFCAYFSWFGSHYECAAPAPERNQFGFCLPGLSDCPSLWSFKCWSNLCHDMTRKRGGTASFPPSPDCIWWVPVLSGWFLGYIPFFPALVYPSIIYVMLSEFVLWNSQSSYLMLLTFTVITDALWVMLTAVGPCFIFSMTSWLWLYS